ncbi:outer membrane efflux protein [Sulfuricella denitrificans skB26]|uniref:Outer membrane efflux protein n=1 Tax=Sulfuricella denitrificans (strain DSM 22764 / NBRC 105220 / skB26) TaxID=1163617 RepID=S6ALZ9_SULDS|nr:TolC family protein [Sulfuricella denitrificans]BAN35724.1 outer membrane efflux protein [Sulfuricella denitrificans skB26]
MNRMLLFIMLSVPLPTMAAETLVNYPDLPSPAAVEAAIRSSPDVLSAQAGIKVGEAVRQRLQAGEHEVIMRVMGQRRSINPSERYREWDIGLERAIRLPGKAALDGKMGNVEVERSHTLYGDALHETGRVLLKAWFSWNRERSQSQQWANQVELLKKQAGIVAKRVRAGDAPRLEIDLAEAAVAQAESTLYQARLREQVAANELGQRFPAISLPASVPASAPVPLQQGLEYWQEEILRHNHELGVARSEASLGRLHSERSSADKLPDPTVGLRFGGERDSAEHIVGLHVSFPFPGGARSARADEGRAMAEMAAQREAAILRKVTAESVNSFAAAQAAYGGWQSAQSVAEKMRGNAELMARAYSLGEMGLPEVLTARRQALEANLAAALARLDAAETRYRLLLDAHQLWPLDADEEDEGHAHY